MNDELAAIGAGDTDAFARWSSRAERPLRLSLRAFAARVDTESLVQETLLRAWQVAPRVVPDGKPDPLLRYALRIARNLALSEVRRARVDPAQLEVLALRLAEQSAAAAPAPPDPALRARIHRCKEQLPDKPAAALDARLDSGGAIPDARLAESLGMTLNTFLQNFTRARRFLLECLERLGVRVEVP